MGKMGKRASDKNFMEFNGVVSDSCRDKFNVKVVNTENYSVLCTLSGEMRKFKIRLYVGDRVRIWVSPYDTGKGIVVERMK